jgi:hypothetical protein
MSRCGCTPTRPVTRSASLSRRRPRSDLPAE